MDSKQLVNDIVNKRLSKARKTINEELSNRVLGHIESKRSDVINEAIMSPEAGLATATAAGVGLATVGAVKGIKGAVKLGKKLHKRFGKKGRLKKRKEKEEKKSGKAKDKYDLAYAKGPAKEIKKQEAKKHKPGRGVELTDKEKKDNQKIDDKIEDIKDDFDAEWAAGKGKKAIEKGRLDIKGPTDKAAADAAKAEKRAKRDAETEKKETEAKTKEEIGKLTDKLKVAPAGGSLSKADIDHNKQIKRDIEDIKNKAAGIDKEGLKSVEDARRKEDEGLSDEEKEAEAEAKRIEKEKEALDTEITTRSDEIGKTQSKMNIDAILGKDAGVRAKQRLQKQQTALDKLVNARAELEPPEEEGEEEVEEE